MIPMHSMIPFSRDLYFARRLVGNFTRQTFRRPVVPYSANAFHTNNDKNNRDEVDINILKKLSKYLWPKSMCCKQTFIYYTIL